MRTSRTAIGLSLLGVVVSCGFAYGQSNFGYRPAGMPEPSAAVTTANPAGEQNWFRLDWGVEPRKNGSRWITGYIYNSYGRAAVNMQLLTQAFDPSGNLIGQQLGWVLGPVPSTSRAYFVLTRIPEADHYKVSVWGFDFIQGVGGGGSNMR